LWQEAHCCLAQCTQPIPLWQEAHHSIQPSCHSWQGVRCCFFGERLVVALLNRCILLGVLALLILGNVHTMFGVLNVPNIGIFMLLVVAWRNMAAIASCKQQHEHLIVAWELLQSSLVFGFYCFCSLQYDRKK
jgi:hypothetical protein